MIDFTFEEFDVEQMISGARVVNPASRNILEKCGFQWGGVELHRFEALGSSTPVDCFRLTRDGLVVAEELGQLDAASTLRTRTLCRDFGRGPDRTRSTASPDSSLQVMIQATTPAATPGLV